MKISKVLTVIFTGEREVVEEAVVLLVDSVEMHRRKELNVRWIMATIEHDKGGEKDGR